MNQGQPGSHYTYQCGGSLPADAPSYVMRQADHDLFDALLAGTYCYVLNSRQMGKSSLRVRTVERLWDVGIVCVEIELLGIGSQQITAAQWYGGIIQVLIASLDLSVNRRQWLKEHEDLSPVQRLGSFMEQVVLAQTTQPIVLCFDEIDSVLGLNFPTDEFFGLVRNWYEKRATNRAYRRLTVVMLGVATPSDLMQDRRATPFNIGRAIELRGFSFEEARPLLPGLTAVSTQPEAILRAILSWTGGQPFLTQKLCHLVTQHYRTSAVTQRSPQERVAEIVRSHLLDNWESQDEPEHLRTIRDRLLRHAQQPQRLLRLYQQILKRGWSPLVHTRDQMELRLTGIVTRHQSVLQPFNPIYQTIFSPIWVSNQLKALDLKTVHPPTTPSWMPVLIGAGTTLFVLALRLLGLLQSLELVAYDRLMRWQLPEPADDRFLITTISEADIQYQDRQGMARKGSLSDTALLQLLEKLEPYHPRVIGLDLYHDFPFTPELAQAVAGSDRLIGVCEVARTIDTETPVSIAAPPDIPEEQVGFTDFPIDADYEVRRQLLGMPGSDRCLTNQSLSLKIALRYLQPTGATLEWIAQDQLKIGTTAFPKLPPNGGGYQLSGVDQGGYQLLLNYRRHSPQQVALMDVLEGNVDDHLEAWVSDRIVLIGLADAKDAHFTPIQPQRMLGVVVHAHMASQIISTVLEDRALIWWLPEWLEFIWVGSWPIVGSVLVWGWRTRYHSHALTLGSIVGGLLVGMGGMCYLLFLAGGWVPFMAPAIALFLASGVSATYRVE